MTLSEVRAAIEGLDTFYSDGVAFEGSMARCPWEVGVDIESESEESTKGEPEELPAQQEVENKSDLKSYWSGDSDLEMEYTSPSAATQEASWMDYSSCTASWFDQSSRSCSPSPPPAGSFAMYDAPRTPPSTYSPLSARSSLPATPEGIDIPMEYRSEAPRRKPLRVDTDFGSGRFFEGCIATIDSGSVMQTAVESSITDPFSSSSFFLASPPRKSAASMMPSSVDLGSPVTATKEMISTSSWDYSADEEDASSSSSHPSMSTSRANSILGLDTDFDVEDMVISPDVQFCTEASSASSVNTASHRPPHVSGFTLFRENSASTPPSSQAPLPTNAAKKVVDEKPKGGSLFSSIRLSFPRSPRASSISVESSQSQESNFSDSFIPLQTLGQSTSPTAIPTSWRMRSSPKPTTLPMNIPEPNCRRDARLLRSRRHWFSPGKLFTAGAS